MHPRTSVIRKGDLRFPRTRGDAPRPRRRRRRPEPLPPHTRGCTPRRMVRDRVVKASPAHAGMHPLEDARDIASARFPRTRGDAPRIDRPHIQQVALPPHTRGCTRHRLTGRWSPPASPAHAGMHRSRDGLPCRGFRFPRTRGDAPAMRSRDTRCGRLPPHTRGCTLRRRSGQPRENASPAHAGMHPSPPAISATAARFPRTRGDAPGMRWRASHSAELPPHTRGCTWREPKGQKRPPASPAHAGMHPCCGRRGTSAGSFPRTRGDAPAYERSARAGALLPPHTRGCTFDNLAAAERLEASPAHAGMHPGPARKPAAVTSFPRTRGDAPASSCVTSLRMALPPHTRGCTFRRGAECRRAGASPAHAGMHLVRNRDAGGQHRFPRTRGDAP